MTDNYLDKIFEDFNKKTKKHFGEVFKIENTELGLIITSKIPIKIRDKMINDCSTVVNVNIKIGDKSILDLQNKYLIGYTNIDNNIFTITDYD
jgi:hypothetical protein